MAEDAARVDRQCDVLIVGGGMAGASLALALSRHAPGLGVAVVESAPISPDVSPQQQYQPSYDARATALAYGSRLIYEDLGLWPALSEAATPIRRIHVSERGRFGSTRMDASDHDQEALGYVVDNAWMGLNLVSALGRADVEWLCPARVNSAHSDARGASVCIEREDRRETWQCGLLVVADGGRSGLREALGFSSRRQDYDQCALIATVTTSRPHEGVAYERFTAEGPVALLPHREARDYALVWTMPASEMERRMAMQDSAFLRELQTLFGWRQGRFEQVGHRHSYPLGLEQVAEPARPGVVLVGNAAHALHPVAGQGFNLALRGLMRLSACLAEAHESGKPLSELETLRPYLREHQQDVDAIVGFSDGVIRVFSGSGGFPGHIRDLGLLALDAAPGARHWLARRNMGLNRRRSSLGHD